MAVKTDDESDQRIYEFNYEDIVAESDSEGRIPLDSTSIVFNSYTEMLEHIIAVKLETGEIIRAQM